MSPSQLKVLNFLKSQSKTMWWTAADILEVSELEGSPAGLGAALKGLFKRGLVERAGGSMGKPTQYKLSKEGRKYQ